jgi:hypothetical protein
MVLYGGGNCTLAELRRHFDAKRPPFRARSVRYHGYVNPTLLTEPSESTWRNHLRDWGCYKFPQNQRNNKPATSPPTTPSSLQSPRRHIGTRSRTVGTKHAKPFTNLRSPLCRQSPPYHGRGPGLRSSGNETAVPGTQLPVSKHSSEMTAEPLRSHGQPSFSPLGHYQAAINVEIMGSSSSDLLPQRPPFPNTSTGLSADITIDRRKGGYYVPRSTPGASSNPHTPEVNCAYLPTPESLKTGTCPSPYESCSTKTPDQLHFGGNYHGPSPAGRIGLSLDDGVTNNSSQTADCQKNLHLVHPRYSVNHLPELFDQLRQSNASNQPEILRAVESGSAPSAVYQLMAAEEEMLTAVESSLLDRRFQDKNGKSALICLMRMGHLSSAHRHVLVNECLKRRMEVNAYDEDGYTALHYWLSSPLQFDEGDSASILRLLLGAGANVDLRDPRGDSALHLACALGLRECTYLLIEHIRYNQDPFYQSPDSGINAKNKSGRSIVANAYGWLKLADTEAEKARIQDCIKLVIDAGGLYA